jgi:hypothetical protein
VVLTRKPERAADYTALLERIHAQGCANACAGLLENGALGCIDELYSVAANGIAKSDPVPCFVGATTVSKQDFRAQCEDVDVPSPDPDAAKCSTAQIKPTTLSFWQDVCGGIHIPFDWTEIRKDKDDKEINRIVAGHSGLSSTLATVGLRVWVPGREFIGSTPYDDPQGTKDTTDWRRPDVDVWYSGMPESIGLIGTTDQKDSIVHAFPRMLARAACNVTTGDEACTSVEGRYSGSGRNCACRDRYAADCSCKPLNPERYFACTGAAEVEGMPCTRHAHCNNPEVGKPNGTCSGQPTCRPRTSDGVWAKGKKHDTGTKCWNDEPCKAVRLCSNKDTESCVADSDCPASGTCSETWCGYHLFNFDDRKQNGIITLDTEIKTGGSRVGRGVCKKDSTKVCNNDTGNPKACGASDGSCRGYTLQAGKRP